MHVENFQERHFLEIKKSNAKNHTGLRWVGVYRGGGYDYVPLLKALTHSKCSYSTLLLKGVTQGSRGMSFNKLL